MIHPLDFGAISAYNQGGNMGVFKKHGSWYIDYYVNGRRKREKIGPNKRQAELVLKKRKVQIAEGKFFDIKKKPKVKFEEMARTYLESYSKPHKKSWRRDETCINNLLPHFEGKLLHEITPLDIDNYKKERVKRVSPRTVNIEVKFLKAMYNKAISWGKADSNPTNSVQLFREEKGRIRYLEKKEIGKLLKTCSDHLRPIVVAVLNTGMRKAEVLNLKWEDVDFGRKIVNIEGKWGQRREVPINKALYRILRALEKKKNGPYVFCNKKGQPYGDITKGFKGALRRAGINNFRFHDLRHTFASHLVMAGVDLKTVQELLGHKTIGMTMRYAHLSPNHKRLAVEKMCSRVDTIWTPRVKKEKQ